MSRDISTSFVRYIRYYILQSTTKEKTAGRSSAHYHWVLADRDVQRDWGW